MRSLLHLQARRSERGGKDLLGLKRGEGGNERQENGATLLNGDISQRFLPRGFVVFCLCSSELYPHDQQKLTTSLLAKNSPRATSRAVVPTGLMDRLPKRWAICPWLLQELGVACKCFSTFFTSASRPFWGLERECYLTPQQLRTVGYY